MTNRERYVPFISARNNLREKCCYDPGKSNISNNYEDFETIRIKLSSNIF